MCMRVLLQGDFLIKDNTNFFLQKKGLDSIRVYFDLFNHWLRTVL